MAIINNLNGDKVEFTGVSRVWNNTKYDFEEIYFGDKQIFSIWAELESPPPITILAAGEPLIDYRIYGNTENGESVGERTESGEPTGYKLPMVSRTENLFDKNAKDTAKGYENGKVLRPNGSSPVVSGEEQYITTEYIAIPNNATNLTLVKNSPSTLSGICFYDTNKEYISGKSNKTSTKHDVISCPTGAVYFRAAIFKQYIDEAMVVSGSTAPTEYIPYYRDEENIYIGSDPLAEDEYVDFGEQKVYKRTSNLFDIRKVPSNIVTITGDNEFQKAETEKFWYDLFDHQTSDSPTRNADTTKCLYLEAGTYTLSGTAKLPDDDYADLNYVLTAQSNGTILASSPLPYTFTLAADNYITIRIGTTHRANMSQIMITAGSETPSTYESYFTPTDPPVPIPALPTTDGETIIDYNPSETPAVEPEKMYTKYRKEGF